ncbi:cuticle protein 16.5-like [Drosophila busckii]|uniref:cuticle protein 16.5-like n=1 Tax=Drosophila busckii TaxID=30019 RepID=UPI0014328876|nr:cuticle protein 16.5-like [Drosophila busckii]
MFKFTIAIIFAFIACAAAKPGLLLGQSVAYSAPLVAAAPAPYVTATSSQVFARNYNGIAAAPVIAPVAAPVLARYAAAPLAAPLAYHAAPLAYSAPLLV